MFNRHVILERYLHLAVGGLKRKIIKTNNINFSCNVCGDGKTGNRMRGHLLRSKSRKSSEYFWAFKCFNEGCPASGEGNAWSAEKWLKFTSKELYKRYSRELFKIHSSEKENSEKEREERLRQKKLEEEKRKKQIEKEKQAIKHFKTINGDSDFLSQKGREFVEKRRIPREVWKRWWVATGGMYRNRLIIPFFNKSNTIYYYQARTLVGDEPKYLNRLGSKDDVIYNIDHIDPSKPVIVLEGIIDSLFIENSIAIIGASISNKVKKRISKLDVYYLFDNDKTGMEKSKKLLLDGEKVFLWNKWHLSSGCKDINDVIVKYEIEKFKFGHLEDYFSKNFYDKLYLEI